MKRKTDRLRKLFGLKEGEKASYEQYKKHKHEVFNILFGEEVELLEGHSGIFVDINDCQLGTPIGGCINESNL